MQVHMMGDTDRGYLLELMVTKLLYAKADEGWQIVGMSATIPNTIDLQRWLSTPTRTHSVYTSCCVADVLVPTDAAMYVTDFRPVPLQEFIKIENKVYDTNFDLVRSLPPPTPDDADQVGALLLYNIVAFALVEVSLLAYLLAPGTTHRSLTALNTWVGSRRRVEVAALLLVVGLVLIGAGIAGS